MHASHRTKGYVPGFADDFCSNEVIVAGLAAANVWPFHSKAACWPSYYGDSANVRLHAGGDPQLVEGLHFQFEAFGLPVDAEVVGCLPPTGGGPNWWRGTAGPMEATPVWTAIMRRTSKRTTWLCGNLIALAGYVLLWFLPERPDAFLPALVVLGIGAAAGFLAFWAMLPDTVEYGEWRSGARAEGVIFGLASFIQKASLGLAAVGLGDALASAGYRANVVQTPETLAALRIVTIVVPASLALVGIATVAFYPLGHRLHWRIARAVARRRARVGSA